MKLYCWLLAFNISSESCVFVAISQLAGLHLGKRWQKSKDGVNVVSPKESEECKFLVPLDCDELS